MIISAKDFKLTPSLKQFAEEKFSTLETHARAPITELKVMLDVDHNQKSGEIYRAEASAVWQGKEYKAGEKGSTMQEAIDLTVAKLARQLRDAKDRLISARKGHHGLI